MNNKGAIYFTRQCSFIFKAWWDFWWRLLWILIVNQHSAKYGGQFFVHSGQWHGFFAPAYESSKLVTWTLLLLTLWHVHVVRLHRSTTQMWPIVTDRVAWSVSLSVTIVNPAKTAEPIEVPFGLWTLVSPRNHVLDGVQISPWEGAILSAERCGTL